MVYRERFAFVFLVSLLVLFWASRVHGAPNQTSGVVAETVVPNSEAAKAGLKEGDIIVRWYRTDANGDIDTPFDLSEIEVEQAPRGRVTLEGFRGTEKLGWTLGENKWGMKVRPGLSDFLLSTYRHCVEMAKAGRFAEATENWMMAAGQEKHSQSRVIVAWVFLEAAESLGHERQWSPADQAYREAVQQSAGLDSDILSQLLLRWAGSYEYRGDLENAEKYYQESLKAARKLGAENLRVADNLNSLGRIAGRRSDFDKANNYSREAATIRQKLAPGSLCFASSLNNLGRIAEARGQLDEAEQYHRQALEIRETLAPASLDYAKSLSNLGKIAYERSDLAKATEYYERGLEIRKQLGPESVDVAESLNSLGIVAWKSGELAKAEQYYRQALEIWQTLAPDRSDVASILNNLGIVALERGNLALAEDYYQQAFLIHKKLAATGIETAASLTNLGDLAWGRGDLAAAARYQSEALAMKRKLVPGSLNLARSLNDLALLEEDLGNLKKAEKYGLEALAIRRKQASGLAIAESLGTMAHIRQRLGQIGRAEGYLQQALALVQQDAANGLETAEILNQLAEIRRDRGHLDDAEIYYRHALEIWERTVPESKRHAESLAGLARTMRLKGQFETASQLYQHALKALENQVTQLGGTETVRADFRAKFAGYYEDYIDLLMASGQQRAACEVVERSRARTLLEMLHVAHVDIRRGVGAELLERERFLRQRLEATTKLQVQLLSANHNERQLTAIKREITALQVEYEQLRGRIRASSPTYAALMQPRPLSTHEIQQLLDDDTVLLEYFLGDKRSYVWLVSSNSLDSYRLPPRSHLENSARRLYRLLSTTPRSEGGPQEGLLTIGDELGRMILGPVAGKLERKRLLIVPDGALQYIPFAILSPPGNKRRLPLIAEHEIVYSPSASVLAELRREASERQRPSRAVAVLADPVFDKDDPRLGHRTIQGPETNAGYSRQLTRSVADVGLNRLPRLAFSRREADAIMATVPEGQGFAALGFDANRDTAASSELAEYRIIHFATHALFDSRHPESSGLVLSLFDRDGKPQNGFLNLQDIYNLNLEVDLAVLSACETALGKEVRGEGLVGLTRGFMYAGAQRVVASLWNADDVATKELMQRFYEAIQKGMAPAAALRQAQLRIRKRSRWQAPYYWATFQLQGEWR